VRFLGSGINNSTTNGMVASADYTLAVSELVTWDVGGWDLETRDIYQTQVAMLASSSKLIMGVKATLIPSTNPMGENKT